jgi:hypothetical protein
VKTFSHVLVATLFSFALTSCVTFVDGAYRTKGAIAVGLSTAVEVWQTVDLQKQRDMIADAKTRAEIEAMLTTYREGEQAKVVKAFRTSRHTLALLSATLRAYEAGKATKPQLQAVLREALTALGELVLAIQAAGGKLNFAELLAGS